MKLVIAEKPSVGMSIASVLKADKKCGGYASGNGYIVSWCVGHLIELADAESYGEEYQVKPWQVESLPILPEQWKFKVIKETSGQYKVLKTLMDNPDITEIICATDAGREGECIFRYVYKLCRCRKPVKRLWISSVEENDIRNGFQNLKNDSEYDRLYEAGYARSKADWLVGINGTRLFSAMYKSFLSVGRVQTPTLRLLTDREMQIKNFKPEKYYTVLLDFDGFTAESERICEYSAAKELADKCRQSAAFIKYMTKEIKRINPPKLFNLADLQKSANRLLGYTAKQTLNYAQALYEKKLITYPRTDSNYINASMRDKAMLLSHLSGNFLQISIENVNPDIVINDSKVTDHHALIPTVAINDYDMSSLPESELKLLMMICSQLILATASVHSYEATELIIGCADADFKAQGKRILEFGWKEHQMKLLSKITGKRTAVNEKILPVDIAEGSVLDITKVQSKEHLTTPPKHFTDSSLISAMERAGNEDYEDETAEKKGIGTQATQAGIIETIIKRQYAYREGKNIIPTDKGMSLINAVPEEIRSPKTTAVWESKLQLIEKGEYSAEKFMQEISEFVDNLVKTYSNPENICHYLSFRQTRKSLGKCPKCGKNVYEYPKSYSCESGKEGCGFTVWKTISGKKISEKSVIALLEKGKTAPLKGFKKKDGSGEFQAALKIDEDKDYKVVFSFK